MVKLSLILSILFILMFTFSNHAEEKVLSSDVKAHEFPQIEYDWCKMDMEITLSSIPKLNEEVDVIFTFTPLDSLRPHEPTDMARIYFRGLEFVSGDSIWVGEIRKGETVTLKARVRPIWGGNYRLSGTVYYCRIPSSILSERSLELRNREAADFFSGGNYINLDKFNVEGPRKKPKYEDWITTEKGITIRSGPTFYMADSLEIEEGEIDLIDSPEKGKEIEEEALIELINVFREENGLPFLNIDITLNKIAKKHSREMVEFNYLDPTSPTQGTPSERTLKAGVWDYPSFVCVAKGESVQELFGYFKEVCRDVILDPLISHVGVSVDFDENYKMISTLHFVRRIVEIDLFSMCVSAGFGDVANIRESFGITGCTKMQYLQFSVYRDSTYLLEDLSDKSVYSINEIIVRDSFDVELKVSPKFKEWFIVIIEAKEKHEDEYCPVSYILQK